MTVQEARKVLRRGLSDLKNEVEKYAKREGVAISEIFVILSMMHVTPINETDPSDDWEDDWEKWPTLTYLKRPEGKAWYNKRIWDALMFGEEIRPGTIKNLRRAVMRDLEYIDPHDKECGRIACKEFSKRLVDFLRKEKKLTWW